MGMHRRRAFRPEANSARIPGLATALMALGPLFFDRKDNSQMLKDIREKFTGGFAIGILVLIGIPFLFFGLNYSFTGAGTAATVDGDEITISRFEQSYRDALQANTDLAQASGAVRVQIRYAVLDRMIRERLIDNHLRANGYQISDRQVTDLIQQEPTFQDDGVFDRSLYKEFLAARGLKAGNFERGQRQRLRQEQLQRAIAASAIVTPAEYRRYLNLVAEQRVVTLATLGQDSVSADIAVSDEMITAYYGDNPTLFQVPDTADIEFIAIRRDQLAANVNVSEEELAEFYKGSKDRYLQDEQRQARHILILFDGDAAAAESTANDLMTRLQAGESFEELAREYSQDGGTSSQGGDLGSLTQSQLSGELGDAIFSMAEGALEGPVKSEYGYHIVRLDSVSEQGPLALDEVRSELLRELRDSGADTAFRDLEGQISNALFDATDLQSIAASVGIDVESASGFSRAGGEPFGANQAAIDAVFDDIVLHDGQISELIELDANTSAIFKVTQYNEATRRALIDVRDEIDDAIRAQAVERLMIDRAEQILAAMAEGVDFGQAAEAAGATVSKPQLISRQAKEIDQAVLFEVFAAGKPTQAVPVRGRVRNIAGGYTVFSLDAVLPGRPESIPLAERDARKLQLAQESGIGDYRAFVQALYDDADIAINDDILAAQDLLQ